jgi:hypothetical protein
MNSSIDHVHNHMEMIIDQLDIRCRSSSKRRSRGSRRLGSRIRIVLFVVECCCQLIRNRFRFCIRIESKVVDVVRATLVTHPIHPRRIRLRIRNRIRNSNWSRHPPVAFSAIVAFSAVLIFRVRLCIDPKPILVLHDVLFPCQVIGLHSSALKQKIGFG